MKRIALLWLLLGGLALAASIATLLPAARTHHTTRTAWQLERARLGTDAYDAHRSDMAYLRAETARREAALAGYLGAVAAILLFAGWSSPRSKERDPNSIRTGPTVVSITLLDGVLAWAPFGLFQLGVSLGFLDPIRSAVVTAGQAAAPLLVWLPYAALWRGLSPALRHAGLEYEARTPLGAVAATLLGPLSGPFLVLFAPLVRRFPSLRAIHLSWGTVFRRSQSLLRSHAGSAAEKNE